MTKMEPNISFMRLRRKEIMDLRQNSESDISFRNVSEQTLRNWKAENQPLLEDDRCRFEYNFLSQRFVIKCMPLPTHDALQGYFSANVLGALIERVGLDEAMSLVKINSGTSK